MGIEVVVRPIDRNMEDKDVGSWRFGDFITVLITHL